MRAGYRTCFHTLYDENIFPSTDCFIVSRLFSVSRYVGRFKLGSKTAKLYFSFSILPLSHQSTYVTSGYIRHYVESFFCLPDTSVLNSYEKLSITRVAAVNSFTRVLNPRSACVCVYVCVYMLN